jgi:hypothetical protein
MKYTLTTILIFISIFTSGQNVTALAELGNNESIPSGYAVIYGNFIQRLGFSSGGFPQDIRLINTETKEILDFRVKPTFKSAKENVFCYAIKPGSYAILNYWWTQSKWYGGKMYTEPIFKGIDATDNLEQKLKSGQIKQEELIQFKFTINDNSLNYLGTWHFDKGLVSFTDDKIAFDSIIKDIYLKLDFSIANIILPN